MNREIERKFLVAGPFKSLSFCHTHILQGYISSNPERSVRIRLKGDKAFITIKGIGSSDGLSRFEWEKEISMEDAKQLMQLCEPTSVIDKIRYEIRHDNHIIEVDEFNGLNKGLVVAEIELTDENDAVDLPEWIGQEVTGDVRYYNSMLAKNPYSYWNKE
ncbi:MAG: CYTH domain-containing protein [Bacteroidales bacterium]